MASMPGGSSARGSGLRQRRFRTLGKHAILSYDRPVEASRAQWATIWDENGRAYLDAYNNVPHVGHCHPAVVAAGQKQLAELNVHSRYLHEGVTAYAERLLQLFPKSLSRIAFTCSGSEANDLAIRIARAASGHQGVIVSSFSYHGNTALLSRLSTALGCGGEFPDWAEAIDIAACGDGASLAAAMQQGVEALSARGYGTAALILDPIFAFEGIPDRSADYLADAIAVLRQAGGLYIADEVQSGFGRLGSMWGWQQFGIEPDIVTLGKPMANGYPMAAAITRPAIGDAFSDGAIYFNTFAASPVGAAMASAVLDVIEEDDLLHHAEMVGHHAAERLKAVVGADRVRGKGLYLGVDLGKPGIASQCMNKMRDRQVLVGTTGPGGRVLKIRPPMCISRTEIDRLADALEQSLGELA